MARISATWIRTQEMRLVDRALILYLLGDSKWVDEFKYQKLLFLVEYFCLRDCGAMPLSLGYFRYLYGPFSKDAYSERDVLWRTGLLEVGGYHLTTEGQDLADYFAAVVGEIPHNQEMFELITTVRERTKRIRGDHLKRTVYMLPTLEDDGLKVRDYPQHHDIITPDSRLPRLEVPEFLMKDLADALSGREVDAEDVAAESAERLRAAIAQS